MADNVKQTVIESGTELEGSLKSECPVTLSGSINGQVTAPALNVLPSGAVKGKVRVSQLSSKGEVSGEVEADTVEISGRVSDDTVIRARSLEVKLAQPGSGVQVSFGNCQIDVGDLPAPRKSEPVAAATKQTPASRKSEPAPAAPARAGEENLADAVADLLMK